MKTWSHFDRYTGIIDKYMPRSGEGNTVASQTCTAVNKLIYKYFNDGDVYDNTQHLEGWANNLSSYANWLYMHCPECQSILNRIYTVRTEDEYTDILGDLAYTLLDADALEMVAHKPAEGPYTSAQGLLCMRTFIIPGTMQRKRTKKCIGKNNVSCGANWWIMFHVKHFLFTKSVIYCIMKIRRYICTWTMKE